MTEQNGEARKKELERLLTKSLAGDANALEKLIRLYRPWILDELKRRMGNRLRSHQEVDDLAQEVCQKAFQGLNKFHAQKDALSGFEKWLRTILTRVALSAGRKAQRQSRTKGLLQLENDLVGPGLAESSTASRSLRRREALKLLVNAVEQLTPSHREAVKAFYLSGLRGNQAAQALGMTPAKLNSLLQRVRKKLKNILGTSSIFFQSG